MTAASENSRDENQRAASVMIDACLAAGVDHFFLAPGSRCTPLTVAVANRSAARVTQHFDERALAFACLGYGQATGRCGVFICTSGTAVANAFPAVVEASLNDVPMLLLTADRPPELRATGANQTIDQVRIFGTYTRWFFDLPCPTDDPHDRFLRSTIAHAIACSRTGPVQLNCMFREPFAASDLSAPAPQSESFDWSVRRHVGLSLPTGNPLVIAGSCRRAEAAAAQRLAAKLACPFLADITSGVRGLAYDLELLRGDIPPADVVIHVGGRVVSKRWARFVEEHPPRHYLHLTSSDGRLDPGHRVSHVIRGDLCDLCAGVEGNTTTDAAFRAAWEEHSIAARATARQVITSSTVLTEPGIAQLIGDELPSPSALFLGNSMPVRDADAFADWEVSRVVHAAANRGASGIDGLIASAVGFALGHDLKTTVLIGDLAALHDLNSLALVASSPQPIILLIVNNNGGGIFHFLPVAGETRSFERFFATPHGLTFDGAAAMFGLNYFRPKTREDLRADYGRALASEKSSLLELRTDRQLNVRVHREIEVAIREGRG